MSSEPEGNPTPEPASGAPEQPVAKLAPKAKRTRARTTPAVPKAKSASTKALKPKAARSKRGAEPAELPGNLAEPVPEPVPQPVPQLVPQPVYDSVGDPIGDVSSGEARTHLGPGAELESAALMEAYRADTTSDAEHGLPEVPAQTDKDDHPADALPQAEDAELPVETAPPPVGEIPPPTRESGPGLEAESQPAAKLERLQKILSQAGVASRRHAEEMIVAGRIMVNGQVVTTLGAKADPARDHIRVDGKLLHGPERHRTFVLNKPKGYVTTVDDPEGRPTVMQFFAKLHERLYPIGRLDYQSEGLLLMTNDGELANRLTRAASAVEKTYLVKVAGRPTGEELDRLRGGVPIERGAPGSPIVGAAPTRIRQVRQGDNPWYEVVLIEGRNRELRKMFQTIGHFVEKIRRVGYGPLVLDLEPGKFRELTPLELSALHLAAEGKFKPKLPPTGPDRRTGKPKPEQTGLRGNKTRVPQQAFRPRGGKPGPPRTSFGQRGGKPGSPRTGPGPRGGKPDFPQSDFRPRTGRPFRETASPHQNRQQRFNDRRFRSRQRPEETPPLPPPDRPRMKHGEHFYLHRPAQPQRRPAGPQRQFDKPFRENSRNRSTSGFSARPAKPSRPEPERDNRRGFSARPGRPPASAPPSHRSPGPQSRQGRPPNRRGPAPGSKSRFGNHGR